MPYTTDEIKAVTFVRGAIHSPHDVRHFMDIGRPEYTVTATINSKDKKLLYLIKYNDVPFNVFHCSWSCTLHMC